MPHLRLGIPRIHRRRGRPVRYSCSTWHPSFMILISSILITRPEYVPSPRPPDGGQNWIGRTRRPWCGTLATRTGLPLCQNDHRLMLAVDIENGSRKPLFDGDCYDESSPTTVGAFHISYRSTAAGIRTRYLVCKPGLGRDFIIKFGVFSAATSSLAHPARRQCTGGERLRLNGDIRNLALDRITTRHLKCLSRRAL